ncbi:MAG: hypothetical protein AAF581_12025 [Planctomycetota bacterium]
MSDVDRVRTDPDSYIHPDLSVPDAVALELLALSICEHTHNSGGVTIRLAVTGPSTGVIEDSGRGMRLEPDPGDDMAHAERALTSIYPVGSASPDVDAVLGELIWGSHGSQGPIVANALCSAFVFQSRRAGEVWEQCYRRGVAEDPACLVGATDRTGTQTRFLVDSGLAGKSVLDLVVLRERIAALCARIPGLDVELIGD